MTEFPRMARAVGLLSLLSIFPSAFCAANMPVLQGTKAEMGLPPGRLHDANSALVQGKDSIRRLVPLEQGFFAKELDYEGIRIKAPSVVDDRALLVARDRIARLLKYLPDARYNLKMAGAELHIIGKDQVTSDLPEHRHLKGKPFDGKLTVDERTRGLGGLLTSCGEENLLDLPGDRYRGRDICTHEFAHNLQDHGLSSDVRQRIRAQYQRSLDKGLWKGAYAATNFSEYFAELTMWYFGTHGDLNMTGIKPANGPEGLKAYDPEAYLLLDDLYSGRVRVMRATLGLEQGILNLDTPDFTLNLVKASQTMAALQPKNGNGFDFTPADRLAARGGNGYHHLGDLTLRLRRGNSGGWQDYDTAAARSPIHALPASGNTLAAADLTPTLPSECPLTITRSWIVDGGRLGLRFVLKNNTAGPIQIGALGLPMIFNNIITDRSLKQAHEICSFFDPYIGQDGGYLQVTRLNGKGSALVVVPDGNTPFEAYQLLNEPTRPSQTFEGAFAWMVHTQAYAEKEWATAAPWNPPTLAALAPGEARTYGVKFLLAEDIRHIEATLTANQHPVAVGIPGYVLPQDIDGKLFLNYKHKVTSLAVEPKDSIAVHAEKSLHGNWQAVTLRGKHWGRARLTVTYDDGLKQSLSYYVIKPAAQAVADLGHFLTTRQWFVDANDPFHRSPSVMSYDREADKLVTQDSRVWIAGLGDEGGSGSWLAAVMKEFGQPNQEELAKYEQFVDTVLWGGLQYKDGPNKYGVRKSLFYYDPQWLPTFSYDPTRNWRSWTSWSKQASEDIGRGYNYPHVVAAYWALYQVMRNHPDMAQKRPWDWYLEQAVQTTKFMFSRDANGNRRVGYVELGLMEGDIFLALLNDLKREGWKDKAAEVEALMKERTERWSHEEYPFGSEMAWDSTGQEEVYAWCKYFGYEDKAQVSINSILGYMPTLPHWAYNGNARRYWDFLYGGKLSRIERQIHHYGSGINAIPILAEYRQHPDDFYLLRVGYGGLMGALTNIDQEGFASVAFHSFPSTLKWDAYSGDYGPNFFGHAYNTATYIVKHPEFGWQAFGGNVKVEGEWARVKTLDSLRKRVYIAPSGLWLTLDAGAFEAVEVNTRTSEIRVGMEPATLSTHVARLRMEQPAMEAMHRSYRPARSLQSERGAYSIPLSNKVTWVKFIVNSPDASKLR